jgi:hypothetical protein
MLKGDSDSVTEKSIYRNITFATRLILPIAALHFEIASSVLADLLNRWEDGAQSLPPSRTISQRFLATLCKKS